MELFSGVITSSVSKLGNDRKRSMAAGAIGVNSANVRAPAAGAYRSQRGSATTLGRSIGDAIVSVNDH